MPAIDFCRLFGTLFLLQKKRGDLVKNPIRLRFVPRSQKLEFFLDGPATIQRATWLRSVNELIAGIPCIPTVSEMFARTLERCWPPDRIRALMVGLYGGELPVFRVPRIADGLRTPVTKPFEAILADGLAWRGGRGPKDPPEPSSEQEWEVRAWAYGRQKLMVPPRTKISLTDLPDSHVGARHVLLPMALFNDATLPDAPVAVFELERVMRVFEYVLQLDVGSPRQEACAFGGRPALLVTYPSLEHNGLTLPFVHLEAEKTVPCLEALYRLLSVKGMSFAEYVAFRRRRQRAPELPPSVA